MAAHARVRISKRGVSKAAAAGGIDRAVPPSLKRTKGISRSWGDDIMPRYATPKCPCFSFSSLCRKAAHARPSFVVVGEHLSLSLTPLSLPFWSTCFCLLQHRTAMQCFTMLLFMSLPCWSWPLEKTRRFFSRCCLVVMQILRYRTGVILINHFEEKKNSWVISHTCIQIIQSSSMS